MTKADDMSMQDEDMEIIRDPLDKDMEDLDDGMMDNDLE
jgi:hypothetical protein